MRTIAHDHERILNRWFLQAKPAEILPHLLFWWGLELTRGARVGLDFGRKIITVPRHYSRPKALENACWYWIEYRIQKRKGRAPGPDSWDFMRDWVDQFFVPTKLLRENELFREAQKLCFQRRPLPDRILQELAEEFGCTPDLIQRVLDRKLPMNRSQSKRPATPWRRGAK